jgi:hypothetical protein
LLTNERRWSFDDQIPDAAFEDLDLGISDVLAMRINITDPVVFNRLFSARGGGLVPNNSPAFLSDYATGMLVQDLIFTDWSAFTAGKEVEAREAYILLSHTHGRTTS